MKTQKLNEEYGLYITDGMFKKYFQPLLTEDFLEFWFSQMPHPDDIDLDDNAYYERMMYVLIGWLGKQKHLKYLKDE